MLYGRVGYVAARSGLHVSARLVPDRCQVLAALLAARGARDECQPDSAAQADTGRIGLAAGRGKTVSSCLVVNISVCRSLGSLTADHSSFSHRILRFAAA